MFACYFYPYNTLIVGPQKQVWESTTIRYNKNVVPEEPVQVVVLVVVDHRHHGEGEEEEAGAGGGPGLAPAPPGRVGEIPEHPAGKEDNAESPHILLWPS